MPVFDPAFDIEYEAGSFPPAFEIPALPASVQRYITSLSAAGLMYFQPSTAPTVTRIVMDVNSPTGSSAGLPTGAPAITANEFQTIDFAYSGTLPTFGKNGTSYFTGEIKNIKAYDGSSLVWDAAIKEDWKTSTDLHDADGNVVGSAINITEDEAEFYTKVDGGASWLGEELFANKTWSTTNSGVWSLDNSLNYAASNGNGTSTTYAYKLNISQIGAGLRCEFVVTDFSGSAGFISLSNGGSSLQFSSNGKYFLDGVKTSNETIYFGALAGTGFGISNSSVKRLIPIAGGA